MPLGSVSIKDIVELVILAGGVLWHFASISSRLMVLEKLVHMLVARSGMTERGGDD